MAYKFYRNLFTGKLTRRRYDPSNRRERKGARPNANAKYGYESYAMAVDPEDIPKAQAILAQHGVQTEYAPTGEPKITSRSHRKRHAEALGFYDRNGGYGDPRAKNR